MQHDNGSAHPDGTARSRPSAASVRNAESEYQVAVGQDDAISLFAVATALVRHRRRIVLWALAGALIALPFALMKPKLYTATLGFVPQGGEAVPSGLASLAGQFGLNAAAGSPAQRPEFYLTLVPSREVLAPIVRDTIVVPEEGDRRVALVDLLEVPEGPAATRIERGIDMLRLKVSTIVVKNGGIVRVHVRTKWPSVSLAVSERILEGVNEFNLRQRQTQAGDELRFVEGLLAAAQDSQRIAEDRIQRFLSSNRAGVSTSPQLTSTLRRLERDADAKTQFVTSLQQQQLDVSTRRSRDTPTITVFESPWVSTIAEPRKRVISVLMGLIFGGLAAVVVTLLGAALARRRRGADPEAVVFFETVQRARTSLLRRSTVPSSNG